MTLKNAKPRPFDLEQFCDTQKVRELAAEAIQFPHHEDVAFAASAESFP